MLSPSCVSPLCPDVDDEYEDEEDQWEEGAEDIMEKGKERTGAAVELLALFSLPLKLRRRQNCPPLTLGDTVSTVIKGTY